MLELGILCESSFCIAADTIRDLVPAEDAVDQRKSKSNIQVLGICFMFCFEIVETSHDSSQSAPSTRKSPEPCQTTYTAQRIVNVGMPSFVLQLTPFTMMG